MSDTIQECAGDREQPLEYYVRCFKVVRDEIARLRDELADKDKRIAKARNLLDRALGDTDPDIEPDEHEDPVYWAMRALNGGSDE